MSQIPRLDWSTVGFCGRQTELELLRTAFLKSENKNDSGSSSGIFIQGAGGCGKSSLVEFFLQSLVNVNNSLVVVCRGKFEQAASDSIHTDPLNAVQDVVYQLLEAEQTFCVLDQDDDEWKANRQILQSAFPRLQQLCSSETKDSCSGGGGDDDDINLNTTEATTQPAVKRSHPRRSSEAHKNKTSLDQLRLALRFLRRKLVNADDSSDKTKTKTIVVFWDDVQWASESALAMIRTLVVDDADMAENSSSSNGRRLFWVVAHRPVMDDHRHALVQWKQELLQPDTRTIHLSDLSQSDVTTLLTKLLRRETSEVAPLAETVYRKTRGNAFFLQQYLLILEQRGHIRYSLQTYRWEWDPEQEIAALTDISDNVVVAVAQKIDTLSSWEKNALTTAAFLGFSHFDSRILSVSLSSTSSSNNNNVMDEESCLSDALSMAVSDGLLEELTPHHQYKFSQDRIREGAYSLVPESERSLRHLTIGRKLRKLIPETKDADEQSRLLMQTASQLTMGAHLIVDSTERVEVAQVSYQAALLAMDKLSFVPAVEFLRSAARLLGDDTSAWKDHYSLMVQIQTARARMEFCLGNLDESIETADEVLLRAKCIRDKNEAYLLKSQCYFNKEMAPKGLEVAYKALEELGFPFPSRRFLLFRVIRQIRVVKGLLRGLSHDELLDLPDTKDETVAQAAAYGGTIASNALITAKPNHLLATLCSMRSCELTLLHGRFDFTPLCFIGWAWFLSEKGEHAEAHRFGRIAMSYAALGMGGEHDFRTTVLFYGVIDHWRKPFQDGVEPTAQALQRLWEVGSLGTLATDFHHYLTMYFSSGLRLQPLYDDCRRCRELQVEFGNETMLAVIVPFSQMVANLMGRAAAKPSVLTGEFMNQEKCIADCRRTGNTMILQIVDFYRMILEYWLGSYEIAGRLCFKPFPTNYGRSSTLRTHGEFFRGMAALACVRRSKRSWRHRRLASSIATLFDRWVRQGVVSCYPLLQLLKAEQMAVEPKASVEATRKAFDEAIQASGKIGVLHLHALANERAGVFYLERSSAPESSMAAVYLERACELYGEWDAIGKVEHMKELYKGVIGQSSSIPDVAETSRSDMRAKSRLLGMTTELHSSLRI